MNIKVGKGKAGAAKNELFVALLSSDEVKKIGKKSASASVPSVAGVKKDLAQLFKNRKFSGKFFETCALADPERVYVFVGWEEKKTRWDELHSFRKLGSLLNDLAAKNKALNVTISFGDVSLENADRVSALLEGAELSAYYFDDFRSKKDRSFTGIKVLEIFSSEKVNVNELSNAKALNEATVFARDLVNTPASVCTPTYLVEQSKEIARMYGFTCEVHDRKRLQKMGAGSLLSVSNGSEEPPYLIKLTYKPKAIATKIVALVGKGITFDSGGYSLKTGDGMETMKCDMSGAAAVLGAMRGIAKIKPDVEVRAYIPTTENMVNGKATRPGDVVTAMSGKTIEILNTDAEGRLILADALTLAEKEGAEIIVDVATLTGAVVVALGTQYAGIFSDDEELAADLIIAGERSGEHYWRMPLAPEYAELIKSNVADIKNIGSKGGGGAITAAMFLKEFIKKARWAHLDIAGTAFTDANKEHIRRGGVGFAVRTLARFVEQIS
jgi:leucyl aminopeptidase